jgi:hypothetical protein
MGLRIWGAGILCLALLLFGIPYLERTTPEMLEKCIRDADQMDAQRTFSAQGYGGALGDDTIVEIKPGVFRFVRPYRDICISQLSKRANSLALVDFFSSLSLLVLLLFVELYIRLG